MSRRRRRTLLKSLIDVPAQVQAFEQKYGQKPSSAPRKQEGGEDTQEKKGGGVRLLEGKET